MIDECFTLDTNILIYALSTDISARHQAAAGLVVDAAVSGSCILTLQALCEFFHVVRRKRLMTIDQAADHLRDLRKTFRIASSTPETLEQALFAVREHGFSFWDAMLWACAREAGCTLILSEDFQDGRELGGVRFENPFRGVIA